MYFVGSTIVMKCLECRRMHKWGILKRFQWYCLTISFMPYFIRIQAFRKMSLTQHPDKNKEANATEVFRLVSKAYEVLTGNESRPLFDYYLAHPTVWGFLTFIQLSCLHFYYFRITSKYQVNITIAIYQSPMFGWSSWSLSALFLCYSTRYKWKSIVKLLNF